MDDATELMLALTRGDTEQATRLVRAGAPSDVLLECLGDERTGVRRCAAQVLGNIVSHRSVGALPALVAAMRDEDEQVRMSATEALARIPHPRTVEALRDAVEDCDIRGMGFDVIETAARALARMDPLWAASTLAGEGDDLPSTVYAAAVAGLGDAADREVFGILAFLADTRESATQRFSAKEQLSRIMEGLAEAGDRDSFDFLLWAHDTHRGVCGVEASLAMRRVIEHWVDKGDQDAVGFLEWVRDTYRSREPVGELNLSLMAILALDDLTGEYGG